MKTWSYRRWAGAAIAITILMSAPGCTLLRQIFTCFKSPQVKVTKVNPELTDIGTAVLHVKLAIFNPNRVGLQLAGVGYDLDVDGKEVASGKTRRGLRLRPSGVSRSTVDVKVRILNLANSLLEALQKGKVDYKGRFMVSFVTPIGNIEVPVSHNGRFNLPKAPPIAVESVRITGINTSGVNMVFQVKVQNLNPFKMPLDQLKMELKINRRRIATVSAPRGLTMNPGRPLRIPLKLNASLQSLGLTIAQALRRPTIKYDAAMNLASGPLKLPLNLNGRFRLAR